MLFALARCAAGAFARRGQFRYPVAMTDVSTTREDGWVARLAGRFVVFDGPDGSGKSTQFQRFHEYVEAGGVKVCEVREPGGTVIGEQIRRVLLDPSLTVGEQMDMRCEMLLYMASRAQLVAERIRPALAAGQLVLADRFISSTLAYQGTAGGLDVQAIRQVGQIALAGQWPDAVVVFDVDTPTALARLNPLLREREFDSDLDRMEQKGVGFHQQVRQGYLDQAAADPQHYLVIDASADADTVFRRLCESLAAKTSQWC